MLWRLALVGAAAFVALGSSSCGKSSGEGAAGALPVQLTVSIEGTGSGRVQSTPAGIDCPRACTATFPAGTSISFSAIPTAGSSFRGWSGACSRFGACGAPTPAASLHLAAVGAQQPSIRLDSNPVRIFIRQWIKFEARLNGVAVPRAAWFLREGSVAGAVAQDGIYSAPEKVGLYHLVATNLDDPRLEGSIAIEVVATQEDLSVDFERAGLIERERLAGVGGARQIFSIEGPIDGLRRGRQGNARGPCRPRHQSRLPESRNGHRHPPGQWTRRPDAGALNGEARDDAKAGK